MIKNQGVIMNIEEAKKEFIRRYKYLYENAEFILSPYMCEESEEEFQKRVNENLKKYNQPILKKPVIYLNINRLDSINAIFEEFLLSDKPLEESKLYHMIEENKTNKDYLDKVKKGLELLDGSEFYLDNHCARVLERGVGETS